MAGRGRLNDDGEGSLLEVTIVVLGSLKLRLPHQDLISRVDTGTQRCQPLMCGSFLGTLHACVVWMCFAPQVLPVNLLAWYFSLGSLLQLV